MVTVVTEAVAATVVFAVEEGVVGSVVRALMAEIAAEAQTVVTTLYDPKEALPACQSAVVEVVFVAALVADVVTVVETVAVLVPAAAEFVLGTLDVVIAVVAVALSAASAVPVVQAVLPVAVAVVGLAWPPE